MFKGHLEVVKYLKEFVKPTKKGMNNAIIQNHIEVVKYLDGTKYDEAVIIMAGEKGHFDTWSYMTKLNCS